MEPFEDILACGKRTDETCGEDGDFHKARCYTEAKLLKVKRLEPWPEPQIKESDPVHADSYSPNGHHRYCQCAECYTRYGP